MVQSFERCMSRPFTTKTFCTLTCMLKILLSGLSVLLVEKGNGSVPITFLGRSTFIWLFFFIVQQFPAISGCKEIYNRSWNPLGLWHATAYMISLPSVLFFYSSSSRKIWECFNCFWGCKIPSSMRNSGKFICSTFVKITFISDTI